MKVAWAASVVGAGVIALLASTSGGVGAQTVAAKYVGSRKCGTCHKKYLIGNQLGAWQSSAHARAFKDLKSDRGRAVGAAAGLAGDPSESSRCLECHVTGYSEGPESFLKGVLIPEEGVGCESCHGAGQNFRKKSIMSDLDLAKSKGLRIPEDKDCRTCHNARSPTWDVNRYSLASGGHAGFDFDLAREKVAHKIPADVKGHFVEIEKRLRKEAKEKKRSQ